MPDRNDLGPDPRLRLELYNSRLVQASDFANTLLALSNEYDRFVASRADAGQGYPTDGLPTLRIREIRNGSIWAELVSVYTNIIHPTLEHINPIIEFGSYVSAIYAYLRHKRSASTPELSEDTLNNAKTIVEPSAKDPDSKLRISVVGNNNTINVLSISGMDAQAIQQAVRRESKHIAKPTSKLHENAVLYWYQVRNTASDNRGDRVIVPSISSKPIKCVFVDEIVKARILSHHENLFRLNFVVDLEVKRVRGKITMYTIVGLKKVHPLRNK